MGDSRNKTLKNSMVDVKTAELAQAVADSEEYKSYLHYLEEIKTVSYTHLTLPTILLV